MIPSQATTFGVPAMTDKERGGPIRLWLPAAALTGLLAIASGACSQSDGPQHTYSDAPDDAVASFEAFIEEHKSLIEGAVRAEGFHFDWSGEDSTSTTESVFDTHVHAIRDDQAEAGLFEATLNLFLHRHLDDLDGFPMPESFFLDFVTRGVERPWVLLTYNGYPYEVGLEPKENWERHPLDLVIAIRDVFTDRLELTSWWRVRCEILYDEGLLAEDDAELCATYLPPDTAQGG